MVVKLSPGSKINCGDCSFRKVEYAGCTQLSPQNCWLFDGFDSVEIEPLHPVTGFPLENHIRLKGAGKMWNPWMNENWFSDKGWQIRYEYHMPIDWEGQTCAITAKIGTNLNLPEDEQRHHTIEFATDGTDDFLATWPYTKKCSMKLYDTNKSLTYDKQREHPSTREFPYYGAGEGGGHVTRCMIDFNPNETRCEALRSMYVPRWEVEEGPRFPAYWRAFEGTAVTPFVGDSPACAKSFYFETDEGNDIMLSRGMTYFPVVPIWITDGSAYICNRSTFVNDCNVWPTLRKIVETKIESQLSLYGEDNPTLSKPGGACGCLGAKPIWDGAFRTAYPDNGCTNVANRYYDASWDIEPYDNADAGDNASGYGSGLGLADMGCGIVNILRHISVSENPDCEKLNPTGWFNIDPVTGRECYWGVLENIQCVPANAPFIHNPAEWGFGVKGGHVADWEESFLIECDNVYPRLEQVVRLVMHDRWSGGCGGCKTVSGEDDGTTCTRVELRRPMDDCEDGYTLRGDITRSCLQGTLTGVYWTIG